MRLAPTLFAAAFAAVAVAHEFQGEDWEHDGEVRKGHPVGFGGEREPGNFKEATWWERFQGKHHHARDADADADIPGQLINDNDHDIESAVHHHPSHHHGGKHHHAAHSGGKHHHTTHSTGHHGHHDHTGEHHKGRHHMGAHKHEHHHKDEKTNKPWDKWGWFRSQGGHGPEILPREASEPLEFESPLPAEAPRHGMGHKGAHQHGSHGHKESHHAGSMEHEKHHKHGHSAHGHKHGFGPDPFEGEHPQDELGWLMERTNHHKPPPLPIFERGLDTEEDDTEEVDPDNELFGAKDFDDDDFDDDEEDEDDESGHLLARAIENAEVEADPNESNSDADYYDLGDDGDNDILDGQLGDAEDVPDDDALTEAGLDEDGDDEDDDDDSETDEDDADEDSESPAKGWADMKRDAKKHHPKPKPKPKGWGIFPW